VPEYSISVPRWEMIFALPLRLRSTERVLISSVLRYYEQAKTRDAFNREFGPGASIIDFIAKKFQSGAHFDTVEQEIIQADAPGGVGRTGSQGWQRRTKSAPRWK
jgi:hypothetical protein